MSGSFTSMLQHLLEVLGAERYAAHAICLTNDPVIIVPYQVGHVVTALSYFLMGGSLLATRHIVIPMTLSIKALYGAFIFLCGLSHAFDILVMYTGIYRVDLLVTMAMAGVSAATAVTTTRYVISAEQQR